MNRAESRLVRLFIVAAFALFVYQAPVRTQSDASHDAKTSEKQHAMSKSGKKLFGTEDALRLHSVAGPKVSPDGTRIAFTASEINIDSAEPGEEWKSHSELWIVPATGPQSAARQYTHGNQSVSSPSWSPDSKQLAFLRATPEKETERQVWLQWVDGGEAEKITSHKGGFTSVSF